MGFLYFIVCFCLSSRKPTTEKTKQNETKRKRMSSSIQHRLTDEERAEFKEIFDLVDEDKGGTISRNELKKLMETLRLHPSEEELTAMMKEVDQDGSGDIDFEEFVTVMSRRVQADYTPEQLRGAFKVFETDNVPTGYVS